MTMTIFAGFATLLAGLLTAVVFFANQMKTSGEFVGRNLIAIAWMIATVLWLIAAWPAHARDPDGRYANSPNKQWFESQRNSAGQWCCNESDGHLYYGDYKINEDGSVTAEGHTIESYKVLKSANPMGTAVWWYVENEGGRTTYCFAPGTLS